MRVSAFLGGLIVAVFLATGCSSQQPRRQVGQQPPAKSERPSHTELGEPRPAARAPRIESSYSSARVTGDFAGYPAVDEFIERMVSRHGFSRDYLAGVLSRAQRKQWTLNYLAHESPSAPPRPGSWSRYRSKFLTERHISSGANFWHRHARDLERASSRYGVSPEHILGIMGVETIYGVNMGTHRVLDALSTLAFDFPRRAAYFTDELEDFLLMVREEGLDPLEPVGSYAGAMGLGQFMPSSFRRFAVDFDGDGRRDLWNPVDTIGSVANYFAGHGWKARQPVVTPAISDDADAGGLKCGFDESYSLATLAGAGIRPAGPMSAVDSVRLLRLRADSGDQYWLGHDNFYTITRYNHSTHYAMAVHQLAEAIKRRHGE